MWYASLQWMDRAVAEGARVELNVVQGSTQRNIMTGRGCDEGHLMVTNQDTQPDLGGNSNVAVERKTPKEATFEKADWVKH